MNQATIDIDNAKISFAVESKPQKYGDGKTFYEFRVLMRNRGRVVGVVDGPLRIHATRTEARRDGYAKIKELKAHRLYVIGVTAKHITNGEAHGCSDCAIALAIWSCMDRMGFGEWTHTLHVVPYACFTDAEGIQIEERSRPYKNLMTGERGMPDLVTQHKAGFYTTSMYEWAMHWDEWAASRNMSRAEWRETYGRERGDTPWRPSPCSFVLDLDAMTTTQMN